MADQQPRIPVGQLTPFDSKKSNWTEWVEVLENYIELNKIESEQEKRALLITSCGIETYQLMRNLVQPAKPKEKTFNELVKVVQDYSSPKPSEIVERFKFNTRVRRESESVQSYVTELRKLSEHCNYGEQLNTMVRDRLVCGVNNPSIQRKLLSESSTLTFDGALKIAVAMESATNNLDDIRREVSGASTSSNEGGTFYVKRGRANVSLGKGTSNVEDKKYLCWRCGGKHGANVCLFKDEQCYKCKQMGHISKRCEAIKRWRQRQLKEKCNKIDSEDQSLIKDDVELLQSDDIDDVVDVVENSNDAENLLDLDLPEIDMWNLYYAKSEPYMVNVCVDESNVKFEADTGSPATIMSKEEFAMIGDLATVKSVQRKLRTYTGSTVKLLGLASVTVYCGGVKKQLDIHVVEDKGPTLLGRDWMKNHEGVSELVLNCLSSVSKQVNNVCMSNTQNLGKVNAISLSDVLQLHHEVFKQGMGTLRGTTAKIHLKEGAAPKFLKARSVPYVLQGKIETALERMQRENIIEAVKFSEWATPVVPVLKPDGTVRICVDYKVTVNQESRLKQYPIPRLEDLLVKLGSGSVFSKLDMSHAYNQLVLDEEAQNVLTLTTHKGLFKVKRLPYGVSSAPAILQRTVESLVGDIPGLVCYLDNILITGPTEADHLERLNEVLDCLEKAGLRLKKKNACSWYPK